MDFNTSDFGRDPLGTSKIAITRFSEAIPCSVSLDSIIPDTVADVQSVLICDGVVRIDSCYLESSYVIAEGVVDFRVLLCTDNGNLVNISVVAPFEEKRHFEIDNTEVSFLTAISTHDISAKLLNPRKLSMNCDFAIDVRVISYEDSTPNVVGSESIEDDMNLQRIHKSISSLASINHSEKDIAVSRDIDLDANEPPIAEIIACKVSMFPSEVRCNEGNLHTRCEATVSLLYRSEQGNCFASEKHFSAEHMLTLPSSFSVSDWLTAANVYNVSCQAVANGYGEMKTVELDFSYDLNVTGITNHVACVTSDMFSTEFECISEPACTSVCHLHRLYSTGLSVNASVTRAEASADAVREILAGFATVEIDSISMKSEKKRLVIEGTAIISLVGDCHTDTISENAYLPIRFTYPFRCELDASDAPLNCEFIADCHVSASRFRADSGRICADLELAIRIAALGNETISYVGRLKLDKDHRVARHTAPVTLCYPTGKETLWDIAKYYKITEECIMRSNGLPSDDISNKKVLLIPHMGPRKQVLSKVV